MAVQFATMLRLNSTTESRTEIPPKETRPELAGPYKLVMYTPTTTATAPPIACTRVTRAPSDQSTRHTSDPDAATREPSPATEQLSELECKTSATTVQTKL